MRWRNLSSRFVLDPFSSEQREANEQPSSASGETGKVPAFQRELGTRAQAATGEKAPNVGADVEEKPVAGNKPFRERRGHFAGSSAPQSAEFIEGLSCSTVLDVTEETHTALSKRSAEKSPEISTHPEVLLKDSGTTSARSSEQILKNEGSKAETVPEGCPPHQADLFFRKLGLPRGRLTMRGPWSNSSSRNDTRTASVAQDGSWAPEVVGTVVDCPPLVHPDTCGATASFIRKHEAPWVFRLDRDKKQMSQDKLDTLDYADTIWVFRGTFVSKVSACDICRLHHKSRTLLVAVLEVDLQSQFGKSRNGPKQGR